MRKAVGLAVACALFLCHALPMHAGATMATQWRTLLAKRMKKRRRTNGCFPGRSSTATFMDSTVKRKNSGGTEEDRLSVCASQPLICGLDARIA